MSNLLTFIDGLFYKSRILLKSIPSIVYSAASGLIVGMLVNTMSAPDLSKSMCSILNNIFQVKGRPLNYLSWISLGIILLPVVELLLKYYFKNRSFESIFKKLLINRIDPSLLEYYKGRITIGTSLTIQQTPDLINGWEIKDISIDYDSKEFKIPQEYKDKYDSYFKDNFKLKGFTNDGKKYMITNSPSSFSDAKNLNLELQSCRYSQIQFYKDNVICNERNNLIKTTISGLSISYPHSLCLHLIVITSDRKILTTLRSESVNYYPLTWSVSLEEQLHESDFLDGNHNVLNRWLKRFLIEEVGIDEDDFDISNFRILSVFLESDIMNCSLCGILKLELKSEKLKDIFEVRPKIDKEFIDWDFLSYEELIEELKRSTKNYHPTSNYRIFMTLLYKFGPIKILKKIFHDV